MRTPAFLSSRRRCSFCTPASAWVSSGSSNSTRLVISVNAYPSLFRVPDGQRHNNGVGLFVPQPLHVPARDELRLDQLVQRIRRPPLALAEDLRGEADLLQARR